MNGNPNAEQKRFQDNLRQLGCIATGAYQVEIHHIFGSKWRVKGFAKSERVGEWLVIPLDHHTHETIKCYTFEWEVERWLEVIYVHLIRFGYNPVPERLIEHVKGMKNRYDVTR